VGTIRGRGREYRRVIDCCCDNPRSNATPAQCHAGDGSLIRMGLRRGEDNLIRSSSHGCSNDLAGLI
jgi:hypothetical protein